MSGYNNHYPDMLGVFLAYGPGMALSLSPLSFLLEEVLKTWVLTWQSKGDGEKWK